MYAHQQLGEKMKEKETSLWRSTTTCKRGSVMSQQHERNGMYELRTSADTTSMWAASRAFPCFSCACLLLLDHVQEHIRNSQVLYLHPQRIRGRTEFLKGTKGRQTHSAASDVALFDLPEAVSVCVRLIYLAERDVHKVIAVHEMPVECLPILELDQLSKSTSENLRDADN